MTIDIREHKKVRLTSAQAYLDIVQSGDLSRMQFAVYQWMREHGPCTAKSIPISGAWKRLSELKRMGCVLEVGYTIDPMTKKNVITWELTGRTPIKVQRQKSNASIIRELREELAMAKREIEMLKWRV